MTKNCVFSIGSPMCPTNLYDKFDLVWTKIGGFTNRRLQTRTSIGPVRGPKIAPITKGIATSHGASFRYFAACVRR